MSFRLVPKSLTLNDLERRNGPYFVLYRRICVRCRRKNSRSLSHLLMSFLLVLPVAQLFVINLTRNTIKVAGRRWCNFDCHNPSEGQGQSAVLN